MVISVRSGVIRSPVHRFQPVCQVDEEQDREPEEERRQPPDRGLAVVHDLERELRDERERDEERDPEDGPFFHAVLSLPVSIKPMGLACNPVGRTGDERGDEALLTGSLFPLHLQRPIVEHASKMAA
ncbi:hypothetical protein DSECCO2_651240 [anaerobic digester metagenome]